MRLIDADALSKLVGEPIEVFLRRLDLQLPPTIDAIEVVRCKDCIHSDQCTKEIVMRVRTGSYLYCPMGSDGFCSHGERKEDA